MSGTPGNDDASLHSLYAKREKVYPREVHGWFATARILALVVLFGLFYGVAWLSWRGQPLVLFDLPARTFHLFGLVFFPQDFFYLAGLMILAALSLFMFTALAGRLWCGYACPQTVYAELFLWIERRIEGDRMRQQKLDRSPWTAEKVARKGAKHGVWFAVSLWTGITFVGYFTPIRELLDGLVRLNLGPWEWFWVVFYGFATYGNAGWMREQVCTYMCPYARFQSAMFDKDTLVIAYDEARGEPRGARSRHASPSALGLGDCVGCTLCVQVCPTGIDIRDGLQYQCIACAACVDVCDDVMTRMGYAPGLISYTTERIRDGGARRVLRPRIFVYIGLVVALGAAIAWHMAVRVPLELDVLRDRNALFRPSADGARIENVYTLKIVNMDDRAHEFTVAVTGIDGVTWNPRTATSVPAHAVNELPLVIQANPDALTRVSHTIEVSIASRTDPAVHASENAAFLGWRPR